MIYDTYVYVNEKTNEWQKSIKLKKFLVVFFRWKKMMVVMDKNSNDNGQELKKKVYEYNK